MNLRMWALCVVAACGGGAAGTNDDGRNDAGDSPGDARVAPDAVVDPLTDAGADPRPDAPVDAPSRPADPFTIDPTKTPMLFEQLATYFAPGETIAAVGSYQVHLRSRTACNAITGCTPWIGPGTVTLMESNGAPRVPPATGGATLKLDVASSPPRISLELAGSPVRFTCGYAPEGGTPVWDCSTYGSGLLWFYGSYLGSPRLDNTTLILWRGLIATDGTYQFVSRLASDLGTAVDGANNLQQMAIVGTL